MSECLNILVVDDESVMRNLLSTLLTHYDHRVELASSGEEALEVLEEKECDVVLSDIKMPGMDGFELLRKVKESRPAVAVILMTGYGDMYTAQQATALGADAYIQKPFRAREVAEAIDSTCEKLRLRAGT